MTEEEKVIAALEHCSVGIKPCNKCTMYKECTGTMNAAMAAAVRLLKEQRKRVEQQRKRIEILIENLKAVLSEIEEERSKQDEV